MSEIFANPYRVRWSIPARDPGRCPGEGRQKRNERRKVFANGVRDVVDIREPLQGSVVIVDVVTQGVDEGKRIMNTAGVRE